MSQLTPALLFRWITQHSKLIAQLLGRDDKALNRWLGKAARSGCKPLVIYSQVAWDDVWQRPQEMALGLSKYRPVLFVSPVQVHQTAGQLLSRWKPLRAQNANRLVIYSPQILSGEYRNGVIRKLNRVILTRCLESLFKVKSTLFLTNSPFVGSWIGKLENASVGYDVIDDFCSFQWSPPEGRELEDKLIECCRFGFTGTWSLQMSHGPRLKGSEFLASGVDFEKFQKMHEMPRDIEKLPGKKVLYVGTLNDRISGKLIQKTASNFPDHSFIFVGPKRQTFEQLSYPSNVHFLGLKPHDELPAYYQNCDLGIMPFADNEAAHAINPVKTLEFLASGLPVLSTPIPDVERFYRPHVRIEEPEDWKLAIQEMLDEGKENGFEERKEFARGKSWKQLCRKVENKLLELDV